MIYSKDKSLVIQLLQPSCRTLEKFYKIASSNEENWIATMEIRSTVNANERWTDHASKQKTQKRVPGHTEDLCIFNIPKFMS